MSDIWPIMVNPKGTNGHDDECEDRDHSVANRNGLDNRIFHSFRWLWYSPFFVVFLLLPHTNDPWENSVYRSHSEPKHSLELFTRWLCPVWLASVGCTGTVSL